MSTTTAAPPAAAPRYRQPRRRNTELLLLLAGMALAALGFVQVDFAVLGHLDDATVPVIAACAALLLVAHVVLRVVASYADPLLLPVAGTLNLLGLVMIHRLDLADAARARRAGIPEPYPDAITQLTWTALGVLMLLGVLVLVRDHRRLQRFTYTSLLLGLLFLLLPLVPDVGGAVGGLTIRGATLWFHIGNYSFQPAEFAKIFLTIFFAGYLSMKRESLALVRTKLLGIEFPRGRDLGPLLVAWLVSLAVLVFETDLGTSLLFFGLAVGLLYIATQRRSWLVLGAVLFTTGAVLAYLAFGHVRLRFDLWLHPFDDASGGGYQIVQSLYSLASGGMFGSGLGQGYPQLVPIAKSDFIVAAFGEEIGLTGLFALLVLYAIIVERGLRTAIACRDSFGSLLAAGLAIVIALQVFIVVGGVTRLIPLTGLTTPFLSQGGSSLVANWIAIALLLRISDAARRPDPSLSSDDAQTQVIRL